MVSQFRGGGAIVLFSFAVFFFSFCFLASAFLRCLFGVTVVATSCCVSCAHGLL